MSLFKRKRLYRDAATKLVHEIVTLLELRDWKEFPPPYRADEVEAINREFTSWNRMADDHAEREKGPGAKMVFHPDAIEPTQRIIIASALSSNAMRCEIEGRHTDAVSSDLKSWLISLSPYCLLNVGRILAEMNLRDKAREVYQLLIDVSYRNCPEWLKESSFVAKRAKEQLAELAMEANQ
jgi:hypothetical protein